MATIDQLPTLTPMILAGGTLLAMASVRNSDIATRSRVCIDEILYKNPTPCRKKNLNNQVKKFNNRYKWLSVISALFSFGIFLYMAIAVETLFDVRDVTLVVLHIISGAAFIIGLCLLVVEFVRGHTTLDINADLD